MMRCPNCDTSLRPLFTSLYCPNSDRAGLCSDRILSLDGSGRWRFRRVGVGQMVPEWATNAWTLMEGHSAPSENASLPDADLLRRFKELWEHADEPGWPMGGRIAPRHTLSLDDLGAGPRPRQLAVFGRSP